MISFVMKLIGGLLALVCEGNSENLVESVPYTVYA